MAGNSNSGGPRKGAGRKSKAELLLKAGFCAPWFTPELQKTKWQEFINSDDPRIALDATKYLCDQLYGKAKQAIEQSGPNGSAIPVKVTIEFVDSPAAS